MDDGTNLRNGRMSDKPTYHPEEFFPTFDQLPKVGQVVICGGQAVNLLASVFLSPDEIRAILGSKGSATSSDMDILITPDLQSRIIDVSTKSKGFKLKAFKDTRQPIKFVILPEGMPDTRIDVLRSIRGVHIGKDRVFEDSLNIDENPYNVINPVTLLIAKAENAATLEQDSPEDKRNDITHTRLMIPIVHSYLKELTSACDPKCKKSQREIMRFLKRLHQAAETPNFKKGLSLAGSTFPKIVPINHILKSKLETLKRYVNQTFMESPPPGAG